MNAPNLTGKWIENGLFVLMMVGLVWVGAAPAKCSDPTMHVTLPLFMIIGLAWSLARSTTVATPAERHGYLGVAVIWLAMLAGILWMYATGLMH